MGQKKETNNRPKSKPKDCDFEPLGKACRNQIKNGGTHYNYYCRNCPYSE